MPQNAAFGIRHSESDGYFNLVAGFARNPFHFEWRGLKRKASEHTPSSRSCKSWKFAQAESLNFANNCTAFPFGRLPTPTCGTSALPLTLSQTVVFRAIPSTIPLHFAIILQTTHNPCDTGTQSVA